MKEKPNDPICPICGKDKMKEISTQIQIEADMIVWYCFLCHKEKREDTADESCS